MVHKKFGTGSSEWKMLAFTVFFIAGLVRGIHSYPRKSIISACVAMGVGDVCLVLLSCFFLVHFLFFLFCFCSVREK